MEGIPESNEEVHQDVTLNSHKESHGSDPVAEQQKVPVDKGDDEIPLTNGTHSDPQVKQRKLQRDTTIREEIHMYSKELTQRVNCEADNGDVKWSNILYVLIPRLCAYYLLSRALVLRDLVEYYTHIIIKPKQCTVLILRNHIISFLG